jgi:hypothetical protein
MMHFAMDYLGKQAPWHMSMRHMISCPICGDQVPEGIAYHRNSFGDRCIIDMAKYERSVIQNRPAVQLAQESDPDVRIEQAIAQNASPKKKAAKGKAKN